MTPIEHNINQYFELARKQPVSIDFNDVKNLVHGKGILIKPKTNWWSTTKFITIMLSTTIITATIIFWNSFATDLPENSKGQEFSNSTELANENMDPNDDQRVVFPTEKIGLVIGPESIASSYEKKVEEEIKQEFSEDELAFVSENSNESFNELESSVSDSVFKEELEHTKDKHVKFITYTNDSIDSNAKNVKRYTKTIDVTSADWFELKNNYGDITIERSEGNKLTLVATIEIETKDPEDEEAALGDFDLNLVDKDNTISVENTWDKYSDNGCSCNELKEKIKIKDEKTSKTKTVRVKNYRIDYVVSVPAQLGLNVRNSRGDINLPEWNKEVKAKVFQGAITSSALNGHSELSVKYGSIDVGVVKDGKLKMFQSKGTVGDAQDLDLNLKYSNLDIKEGGKLKIDAFQAKLTANNLRKLKGKVKYSGVVVMSPMQKVKLSLFQAKVKLNDVDSVKLSGSYSKVELANSKDVRIKSSFQDKFIFQKVDCIEASLKYTSLEVASLSNRLYATTFQGNIEIGEVTPSFNSIDLDSKYTPVVLKFDPLASYRLKAKTNYTSLEFPDKRSTITYENKQNQSRKIEATVNGTESGAQSLVDLTGFQGRFKLL